MFELVFSADSGLNIHYLSRKLYTIWDKVVSVTTLDEPDQVDLAK